MADDKKRGGLDRVAELEKAVTALTAELAKATKDLDELNALIRALPVVVPAVYEEGQVDGEPYSISAAYSDKHGRIGLLPALKPLFRKRAELEGR